MAMRVVVDTNVVLSSFFNRGGPPARILHLIRSRKIELFASEPILFEYDRILRRPKSVGRHRLSKELIDGEMAWIRRISTIVEIGQQIQAVNADPDDDIFIECAVSCGADFIISGDRHLLWMGSYEGIPIVTAASFVAYLDQFPGALP